MKSSHWHSAVTFLKKRRSTSSHVCMQRGRQHGRDGDEADCSLAVVPPCVHACAAPPCITVCTCAYGLPLK